jgi:hypothetical protein
VCVASLLLFLFEGCGFLYPIKLELILWFSVYNIILCFDPLQYWSQAPVLTGLFPSCQIKSKVLEEGKKCIDLNVNGFFKLSG